jgi:hypothetical protein
MTQQTRQKRRRPRSPAVPSLDLEAAVADVTKLYKEFSHGSFSRSEIASTLGMSADSGPFGGKFFSLKEYGLLEPTGSDFRVSELHQRLTSGERDSADFKNAALSAIRRSDVFAWVLNEAGTKLPGTEIIAKRLENQKQFNDERAKRAAEVLHAALRYAGVLDRSNNILPVRSTDSGRGRPGEDLLDRGEDAPEVPGNLSLSVPLGPGRVAMINYPQDLTARDAAKIGNVLRAVAEDSPAQS